MAVANLIKRLVGRLYLKRFPWHIPPLALGLSAVGTAFIVSAGYPDLAVRHVQFTLLGCAAFAVMALLDYRRLGDIAAPLYLAGLLALAGLPILGTERNFARRWYDLGLFLLQPSEPMKIVLVVALAAWFQMRKGLDRIRDLLLPLGLTAAPMLMILLQPDLGTSMMLLPSFFVIAFLAGVRVRNLAVLVLAGCLLAAAAWFTPGVLKPYQKERVLDFAQRRRVAGTDAAEHAEQVLRAIQAGGLHGEGWGRGVINRRKMLSERHTDFIFAVIAEEWGLFGTAGVMVLYAALIAALAHAAATTHDSFGRLVAGGIMAAFALQCLLNMAVAVRLAPITGLTLPLVSYGGSSLVSTYAGFGIVASVRMRRTLVWTDEQAAH